VIGYPDQRNSRGAIAALKVGRKSYARLHAPLAHLAEQRSCKAQVIGSNPIGGSLPELVFFVHVIVGSSAGNQDADAV
jgi:hypothetical protein